ncbi:putative sulfate exporter family transporter [Candidatus Pelagibacter ubique]|nr:putative sulfate exporter family transporter [Candidatus Pelagibacter ubique]MDC3356642.1 putative sulfate exporter family transporter [Candidatus Pelagibacter ubique]
MLFKKYLVIAPGIILAFVLYTLSQGFNNIIGIELLGYDKSPISTAMIAIVMGIVLRNIFQLREGFLLGLNFTQKYILKLGIICLGIQLKPFEFLKFGSVALPLIIVCIISVLIVIKLLIKKLKISTRMAYLISIGSTVCGTTAIMATAPIIKANKGEVAYAIANITVFGIISMLVYPYFANVYFNGVPMYVGLFLGTAIHETSQVAAAGLIYDQQFDSPETLNIATVTKLIRNTFLIIMIPLFAYLYNRNETKTKNYSLINIFPYFVLGFIGMIIFRNIGDQLFLTENTIFIWNNSISIIKESAKIFLSMAMAAVGLSTNLKDLKSMGYKPFVVGFVAMITVGLVSIISMKIFTELFL